MSLVLNKGRRLTGAVGLLALIDAVALITGCGSASPSSSGSQPTTAPSVGSAPSSSPAASPSPETIASPIASEHPDCPNSQAGRCLGKLTAGTYTTEEFHPATTYTVPAGWGNYEDLTGNFLLIPPGGTFFGVDAGKSDYLGIYSSVTVEAPCTEPTPGVRGPTAMSEYITGQPEFTTSNMHPVTVGGLTGVVLDITLAKTWKTPCIDPDGAPSANLIAGLAPSDFEHGLGGALAMRLYLLSNGSDVIAVELDDVSGGGHLNTLDEVAKSLRFAVAN